MIAQVEFADQIWWYTSRAAGIVAWILLSLSVLAGMSIAHRRVVGGRPSPVPPVWRLDLHRFLSALSMIFLFAHMGALVPDNFVHFGLAELLVPMQSEWQPADVAWGIVAFWLVLAVEITSLVRNRLPHRAWRIIHTSSFGVWAAATVHLLLAGTDAASPVFRVVQVVVIALVIAALLVRLARQLGPASRAKRASARSHHSAGVGALPIEEPIDVDKVDTGEGREFAA